MNFNTMMINDVYRMESFVKRATIGLDFGFVGSGQGGGKIVDGIASIRTASGDPLYTTMVFNSNLGDMAKLRNIPQENRIGLIGYENGVGKDPEVGYQAFMDKQNAPRIFSHISKNMGHCRAIFIVVSLGGGTGTGAVNALADALSEYLGIPVFVVVSLPQPDETESRNAFNALQKLAPKLQEMVQDDDGETYRMLESLIILDNKKIVEDHINEPEKDATVMSWDQYSNAKLISTLHEWNVLTTLESDFAVDAEDLFNHVMTGGGVLTFAKKRINMTENKSPEDLLKDIVSTYRGKNVLANGFDYESDMQAMAMVIVMPEKFNDRINLDTLERIRIQIKQELPNISFFPGSVTGSSDKYAVVYTMARMGGLPQRAKELLQEANDLRRIRIESESKNSGFSLGGELVPTDRKPVRRGGKRGINPFEQQETPNSEEIAADEKPKSKRKNEKLAELFAENNES